MTKKQNRQISIFLSIALLVFIWAFIQPQSVQAQWTTPANTSDNISNTNTNGNVGIGTTTPGVRLHLVGDPAYGILRVEGAGTATASSLGSQVHFMLFNPNTTTNNYANLNFQTTDTSGTRRGGPGIAGVFTARDASTITGDLALYTVKAGTVAEAMRINSSGNVGIGTTSPGARLTLFGNISAGAWGLNGIQFRSLASTYTDLNSSGTVANVVGSSFAAPTFAASNINTIYTAASTLYIAGSPIAGTNVTFTNPLALNVAAGNSYFGGKVGVGAMNPGNAKLRIYSGSSGATEYIAGGYPELTLESSSATDLYFLSPNTGSARIWFGSPSSNLAGGITYTHNATVGSGYLSLLTGNNSEKVRIQGDGNVGIGKVPGATYKLDVAGNINATGDITATGTIAAKYQDVAEWVPSIQKLKAGTVVILDPERTNQVIASTEAYDTRVAGVISEQPGLILGEGGEGKVKVATTGRVKVKVDATKGAIKIGDLLVTSDKEGVAIKSVPIIVQGRKIHAPGTIIGKALEALENGEGEILVLLSLQ